MKIRPLFLLLSCGFVTTSLSFSLQQPECWTARRLRHIVCASRTQASTTRKNEVNSDQKSGRKHYMNSNKAQLRRIQGNLKRLFREQPNICTNEQEHLTKALGTLATAKTIQQVTQVGRELSLLDLSNPKWYDSSTKEMHIQVLERVIKATAMTGLLHIALNLSQHLLDHNHVPSDVCQDAISKSLRKGGKLTQFEQYLKRVGKVATSSFTTSKTPTSQFAYNMFLAALCDVVTDKTTDRSLWAPVSVSENLQLAFSWLDSTKTKTLLGLEPDAVSYGAVLNAASQCGNTTLANEIWGLVTPHLNQSTFDSIQLYNARIKSLKNDDHAILHLWDKNIQSNPALQPDRYSIDLVLMPLLRAGRIGDIEKLLDAFIFTSSHSSEMLSKSFEAFLLSLSLEDVAAARAIFDMYVGPSLAPVLNGPTLRLVRPTTRHFNHLIEGYRRQLVEVNERSISNITTVVNITNHLKLGFGQPAPVDADGLRNEAWKLYNLMLTSPKTPPDEYTITSMIGICGNPRELTNFLDQAVYQLGIDCASGVLRAAISAFGELGDPSSACALFAKTVEPPISTRYWNTLLGALSAGKLSSAPQQALDVDTASVNRIFRPRPGVADAAQSDDGSDDFSLDQLVFVSQLDGLSCWEAVETIVNRFMKEPDSQTYCLMAKAAQNNQMTSAEMALEIFRNATSAGIPADGRFVNAVIRCFGDDLDAAITAWKEEIRQPCFAHENRIRSKPVSPSRIKGKNLVAAYHGLIYVSGRALRPDIALRLVYAMTKEGLVVDENALNCYQAGKRQGRAPATRRKVGQRLREILKMVDAYESLLYVECVKYDQRDKRREGEKRIRIIL